MADMCSIMITGRLTNDSELVFAGQTPLLKFSVAVGRYEKGKNLVSYFDCQQWGRMAETLSTRLTKGSPVVVRGEMRQEFWEDRTSGQRRSKWILQADNFGVQPLFDGRSGGQKSNHSDGFDVDSYDDFGGIAQSGSGWDYDEHDVVPF